MSEWHKKGSKLIATQLSALSDLYGRGDGRSLSDEAVLKPKADYWGKLKGINRKEAMDGDNKEGGRESERAS